MVAKARNKKWAPPASEEPTQNHLQDLKKLFEDGKVVPAIDRRYLMSELAEAIGYVETGHARSKVVITVESNRNTYRPLHADGSSAALRCDEISNLQLIVQPVRRYI